MSIKVVLCIVRSFRLRQWIDMILSKPWNTHNMFQKYFSKRFWSLKVRKTIHQNSLFGGQPCNFVSKLKNHHLWTFVSIKVVLSIVRSSRLRQRIDMILSKPWNTYNVFQKYFFKKFEIIKVRSAIHPNSLLRRQPCNSASKSKNHH